MGWGFRFCPRGHTLMSDNSGGNGNLQLLAVRQLIDRVEAVVSWLPGAALQKEATGTQLHLASRVLPASEPQVVLIDGPRAIPGGRHDGLVVLPLEVPTEPGHYRIQVEPVVEHRFWACDRGYQPIVLRTERTGDGQLRFECVPHQTQSLNPAYTKRFSIETPLYGFGDSERCVEIPWVLGRCGEASRVLDASACREARYTKARAASKIPFLVDLSDTTQSGVFSVAANASAPPFRNGTFDLVLAISVIWRDSSVHLGIDDGRLFDLDAVGALASILRTGGRMLLTVPFGRFEDHGSFLQYDQSRLLALVESTNCELTLAEYYADGPDGWTGPVSPTALSELEYRPGFAARAVACLELTRRGEPGIKPPSRRHSISTANGEIGESLSSVLSPGTRRILKQSGAWSKMHGETGRMRPVLLLCETVNVCNADCVFCPYSKQTRARGFMAQDLFESILEQYSRIGGGNFSLTPMVGDPLLDRLWMQRIRLLAENRGRVIPSITTNLYALERYSDQEVCEMLGVFSRIHVSCYGITPEECEAITRRRLFDRFLTQTRRLLSLRQISAEECEIQIGFRTMWSRTAEEIEAFLREHFGVVVPYSSTHRYANWGNSLNDPLPGGAEWVADRTNESSCILLPLAMQVYWDGRVSACACCDYDSSSQLFLGDLKSHSLMEIFNNRPNQEIWRQQQAGCLQPICRNCTFHVPLSDLHSQHPIIQNPLNFIGG
jgi:hypothetical protein